MISADAGWAHDNSVGAVLAPTLGQSRGSRLGLGRLEVAPATEKPEDYCRVSGAIAPSPGRAPGDTHTLAANRSPYLASPSPKLCLVHITIAPQEAKPPRNWEGILAPV